MVPSTSQPAVQIRDLRKVFGAAATRVVALAGIDLDIPAGQFLAVMGPSGSGKSTLLHLVAGLDQSDGGSIRVSGHDILALSDDELTLLRRRRLGLVFQAFNLLDALTAAENVALPLIVDGINEAAANECAAERLSVWASAIAAGTCRRKCQGASSNAWPSPGPWPLSPSCYWPTNRRATSTRTTATR